MRREQTLTLPLRLRLKNFSRSVMALGPGLVLRTANARDGCFMPAKVNDLREQLTALYNLYILL